MKMEKLFKKVLLSDKDYEYLTKVIAMGVGIGILIGLLFDDVIFFFSLGGVVGVLLASILILIRKLK